MTRTNGTVLDGTGDSLQRYLKEAAASRPLSAPEEASLASRVKTGDLKARNQLVEANLKFVISVAREYRNQGLPLTDLISAGNVGLIMAAERFDETKGFKFITYAVWWIRQSILQTLMEHGRVVRLPANRVALLRRIFRYIDTRQQKTSARPTEAELAQELGVSAKQLVDTLASGQHALSLDTPCGDEDENSLMEIVPDNRQEPPDVLLLRDSLREEITSALEALEAREQEVIRLYFGLDGTPGMTLKEIGSRYGLTRERVRQIKEKALCKLRHPARARNLVPYTVS